MSLAGDPFGWLRFRFLNLGEWLGFPGASESVKTLLEAEVVGRGGGGGDGDGDGDGTADASDAASAVPSETAAFALSKRVAEAFRVKSLLDRADEDEELSAVVQGVNGGYVSPVVGGDLLRDTSGVRPRGMRGRGG